jgi:hypothetical protein
VWCGGFERAGDVVQREKEEDRTENRIEGEERRGREGRGDNDDDDDDKKEHFVILRSK